MRLYDIAFHAIGEFGGARLEVKLKASIDRQFALMEFIREKNVEKLVCLCSVDANRVAFGLGIRFTIFMTFHIRLYGKFQSLPRGKTDVAFVCKSV